MSKKKLEYYVLPVPNGFKIVSDGPNGVFYQTITSGAHLFFDADCRDKADERCRRLNAKAK